MPRTTKIPEKQTAGASHSPAIIARKGPVLSPPAYHLDSIDGPVLHRKPKDEEDLKKKKPLPGLQTQLLVGASDDPLEREADAVAEQVVRMQPTGLESREPGEKKLRSKPLGTKLSSATPANTGAEVSPSFESSLNASRGGGRPMPKPTLSFMEQAFGTDFSEVRIHTDLEAVRMSEALGAKAFTLGRDVYFNAGEFQPETTAGKRLLGHELGHVVQGGEYGFLHKKTDEKNQIKFKKEFKIIELPPKDFGGYVILECGIKTSLYGILHFNGQGLEATLSTENELELEKSIGDFVGKEIKISGSLDLSNYDAKVGLAFEDEYSEFEIGLQADILTPIVASGELIFNNVLLSLGGFDFSGEVRFGLEVEIGPGPLLWKTLAEGTVGKIIFSSAGISTIAATSAAFAAYILGIYLPQKSKEEGFRKGLEFTFIKGYSDFLSFMTDDPISRKKANNGWNNEVVESLIGINWQKEFLTATKSYLSEPNQKYLTICYYAGAAAAIQKIEKIIKENNETVWEQISDEHRKKYGTLRGARYTRYKKIMMDQFYMGKVIGIDPTYL